MQPVSSTEGTLSEEQVRFLQLLEDGENLCVIGPGGVGKSFAIDAARRRHPDLVLCASTGIAAVNIGGRTIHNFFGLGLGEDPVKVIYSNLLPRKGVLNRIRKAKKVIIDEVSMVDGELLQKIDELCKMVRRDTRPFGGIQVVLVGDALQLSPVKIEKGFFFQSQAFKDGRFKTIHFTKVFRQRDREFIDHLIKLRYGIIERSTREYFEARVGQKSTGHIEPVEIYATNKDVDVVNTKRLASLPGEQRKYTATDLGEEDVLRTLAKNCPAATEVSIRVGAQVMLLSNVNVEEGLVNGSIGVVQSYCSDGYPFVKFKSGEVHKIEPVTWEICEASHSGHTAEGDEKYDKKVIASRRQVPLRVCYAVTAHKIQGATLDCAKIDLSNVFAHGQAYVALSRVRDINSLFLLSKPKWEKVTAHPDAVAFCNSTQK